MQSGYTINKRFERISTFHNVGQRTLQALYVCIGLLLYSEGRMEEHGFKGKTYNILQNAQPVLCNPKNQIVIDEFVYAHSLTFSPPDDRINLLK